MSTAPLSSTSSSPRPRGGAELTAVSIGTGIVLSIVMGAANVYLGLRVGMTVSASIPAAVLASGLLRGVFRRGSILEANIVQTSASAGESLAAGIIFTMPALILTGTWTEFDFWTTTLIALSGGLLGILMMIPMRRAIVIEATELKFPEGVACAEVLRAGAGTDDANAGKSTGTGSALVVAGLLVGAGVKFVAGYLGLLKSAVAFATRAGGRTFLFGMDVSPALIGVGLIVGLPIAIQVFLGGALGWYVFIPLLSGDTALPTLGAFPIGAEESAYDHAFRLWSTQVRYVGVGAMVVGGLAAIWKVRHGIASAFRELLSQFKPAGGETEGERNLELKYTAPLAIACAVTVFGIYYTLLEKSLGITALATIAALVLSFFFTAVASYIVGLVGNSNSPVSGMTISAVLATGALLLSAGYTGETGILAMLGVAGVVCCVACTSGDVCNDLKTGQLVGATPRSQQIAQIIGVVVAAFVMAPVLTMLHEGSINAGTGGIGGSELTAPQAGLFASLAQGFFGDGDIPKNMVAWGALIGVLILLADIPLALKNSSFRLHVMPIAVGIYLPAELSAPILLGGLLHYAIRRTAKVSGLAEKRGVLLASGIIAGESLTGVLLGMLAFMNIKGPDTSALKAGAGLDIASLIMLAAVCAAIWFFSSQRGASGETESERES